MVTKYVLILLIKPINLIRKIYFKLFNLSSLKINRVNYKTLPIINGKLIIANRGHFTIGSNLKFNSRLQSNFVGLYKPCTIEVTENAKLIIGNNSGFSGVSIYCADHIIIGENLFCGGNVSIWDTDFHPLDYKTRETGNAGTKTAPIHIGNSVFIGANSIILKGVTIGNRVIIGAGSVITKNIPDDEIWAGNPARKIR